MEQVDTLDSKSSELAHEGSIPSPATLLVTQALPKVWFNFAVMTYEWDKNGHSAFWSLPPILGKDVTAEGLAAIEAQLPPGHDIVLTSKVGLPLGEFHLPMIDFAPGVTLEQIEAARPKFRLDFREPLLVYRSSATGFHGYIYCPVGSLDGWLNHLRKHYRDLVDEKWVGHADYRRFAALRWTARKYGRHIVPTLVPNGIK